MRNHVWLLVVKYCCGVVVDYNSDSFSAGEKATNCKKSDMKRKNAMPRRTANIDPKAAMGIFLSARLLIHYDALPRMIVIFLA